MGFQTYDERILNEGTIIIQDSDGTAEKQFGYGGPHASRIDHVIVSSTDVIPHDVTFFPNGGTSAAGSTVTVPAGAGYLPGVPAVDLVATLPSGVGCAFLRNATPMSVQLAVAVGTGFLLAIMWTGGDF